MNLCNVCKLIVSIIFFANNYVVFCTVSTSLVEVASRLQQQLLCLNSQTPFVTFGLGLSDEHKMMLQNLCVHKEGIYNNFGNFSRMKLDIELFLKDLGNDDYTASTTAKIIHDIVVQMLSVLHQESAWVAVRSFKKNDSMVIPRWHTDGEDPAVYAVGCKYKITCTLKGPGTIFCSPTASEKKRFYDIVRRGDVAVAERRRLCHELFLNSVIKKSLAYEATLFLIGDDAAIHSEPDITQDRLYLGILPGTCEQIKKFLGK